LGGVITGATSPELFHKTRGRCAYCRASRAQA
jgi:hypothetical protein